MKKVLAGAILVLTGLTLTGCTMFYPNWGQKTPPADTPTPSASSQPTASASATPTHKPKQPVSVDILQSDPNAADSTIAVIAQATGISEDGGTCTLTVKQGANTKSVTAKAESNVTDTQCFPLNLSIVGLAPGDASFTVAYNSDAYTGTSSPQTITIP